MKKILIISTLVLLILMVSCAQQTTMPKESKKTLSDLQIEACKTADEAGTCSSRLEELGIVQKEECCEVVGKCC